VSKPLVDVALALVYRQGRWLVARRPAQSHLGRFWEFPGGKRAPGEDPPQAAIRELREECGVEAVAERLLDPITHDYGDRVVRLTPVICRWVAGEPRPLGNEACCWVNPQELRDLMMPEINKRIVTALIQPAD